MLKKHAFALLLMLVVGQFPSSVSAFTPAEIDSAAVVARQIDTVDTIADDVFEGRNNNTAGSAAVQSFLINELKMISNGLNSGQAGDNAYRQAFNVGGQIGTNLLGVIPGTDLVDEYVMIGAHFDHLGVDPISGDIMNGAYDNASGVAVVLAIGAAIQALPTAPRRSVILALWDAEEDGLVGSEYFKNNPIVLVPSIVTYVNFDGPGANLLPSLQNTSFAVGAESGGAILESVVQAAAGQQNLNVLSMSRAGGQDRSDHATFIDSIPIVYFTDATTSCYHQAGDEAERLDLEKLREQSQVGFRVVIELAETATPPVWAASTPIPNYNDAVVVEEVLSGGIVDLGLFPSAQQIDIQNYHAEVQAVVAAGPGAFNCLGGDCQTLAVATINVLDYLVALPCSGFGALTIDVQATPAPVALGGVINNVLTAENTGALSAPLAEITDMVPPNATYVPGSASDGGSESGGIVSWPAVTLAPSQIVVRSFSVEVDSVPMTVGFLDGMESGAGNWSTDPDAPGSSAEWQIVGTNPYAGSNSWFAANLASVSDQVLGMTQPFVVPPAGATFSFRHEYNLEAGYDGGVVEYSSDGGVTWLDLWPYATDDTYTYFLQSGTGNPLATRAAFSGASGAYLLDQYNLSSFIGTPLMFRFRLVADNTMSAQGWWIDDVSISNVHSDLVVGDAQIDAGGAAYARAVPQTIVVPEPGQTILSLAAVIFLAALVRRRDALHGR